jgi:hypothetical protein
MSETRIVFVAQTCTDLTEGRGAFIPLAVCELESTAIRMGKGRYVQGTDCPVSRVELLLKDGMWWAPVRDCVRIHLPSNEDKRVQEKATAAEIATQKALASGLTKEDIDAIRNAR